MFLTFEPASERYVFICHKEQRFTAKDAGFEWDAGKKQWYTEDPLTALTLSRYADSETAQRLSPVLTSFLESQAASHATDSNIIVPSPMGLSYLPYQLAGIAYCYERIAAMIGDEMGLGKTIQAIGLANLIIRDKRALIEGAGIYQKSFFSMLVISPASLKLNWSREIAKWIDRKISYGIAQGNFFPRGADIVIINYDIVGKHIDRINNRAWDLVVCDEGHYIKNGQTARSKAVFRIENINRKLLLTGTPIPNRPAELYNLLHWLLPDEFNNYSSFARRYCGGMQSNGKFTDKGASNLEELQTKLRSTVMIRRLKRDVLKDLPPKRRQVIEFPAGNLKSLIDKERQAFEAQEKALVPIKMEMNRAKDANDIEQYKHALSQFRGMQTAILANIAALRKQVAVAKIPLLIEHLEVCIESSYKVVVFAHHHDVMDRLRAHFGRCAVKFSGQESLPERQRAVDLFQEDKNIRLFIGSLTAAGVGITLTASSHGIFGELDWVPGTITQAEDRLHRIGQINSVLIQHTVLEGSLDYRIATQLIAKQEIIERALNQDDNTNGLHTIQVQTQTPQNLHVQVSGMSPGVTQ